MKKIILTALLIVPLSNLLVMPVAHADKYGVEGRPPVKTPIYTCEQFKKDVAEDTDKALKQFLVTFDEYLSNVADEVAYKFFQVGVEKGVTNNLSTTLIVHRELLDEMKTVKKLKFSSMKDSPVKSIIDDCNLREGMTINQMADVAYVAYVRTKEKLDIK